MARGSCVALALQPATCRCNSTCRCKARSLELFDKQRLDYLSDGFGEFTEVEARDLANALECRVLPELHPGERVLLDGAVTQEPDDGMFHRAPEEQHRNYAADHDWLIRFVAFCKQSGGIFVR